MVRMPLHLSTHNHIQWIFAKNPILLYVLFIYFLFSGSNQKVSTIQRTVKLSSSEFGNFPSLVFSK